MANNNPTVGGLQLTVLHLWSSKLVKPLIWLFKRLRIDPNWFTFFSLVFSVGAGYALATGHWWWAIITILLNGLCDVIDGELARNIVNRPEHLQRMGIFLDPYIDRIADLIIFAGIQVYVLTHFFFQSHLGLWFCLLVILTGPMHILSSYVRILLKTLNVKLSAKKPLTRAGFHVQLVLLCLLEGLFEKSYQGQPIMFWGVLVICLLTISVFIKRSIQAFRLFRPADEEEGLRD